MRGASHLILSTAIACGVAMWLFAPIFAVPISVPTLQGYAMVAIFILFAAVGSIAPDADVKHSLIRSLIFAGFFLPYWLLALVPLSFMFDFRDEPIASRINQSLFRPKHRGVMHSFVGLIWSMVVVYGVTAHLMAHYPAMAAVEGFTLGYLLHLIEDVVFTDEAIKPFVVEKYKIG